MAEYYGINEKPVFEGLSTYRSPLVYELAGRKFDFVMDNGKKFHFDFLSGTRVMWGPSDESEAKLDRYECLKCDDRTYLVNMEVEGADPRMGLSIVIDDEQDLVTMVYNWLGAVRKYPYLVTQEIVFGAIAVPGKPLNTARHSDTTDLTGKRIHWHYSPDTSIIHVYYSDHFVRITFSPRDTMPMIPPERLAEFERFPYDEPTRYIKIKKDIYLVVCNEEHKAKLGKTGNNMLFLENLRRVHDVGRSFGLNDKYQPENYMFSAYGEFVKSDGEIESRPYVYIDD